MTKIKDFCLVNLNSKLLTYLDKDNLQDVGVLLNVSDELLDDFNKRRITPDNIEIMYNITEYFMIDDNINFLIKHSIPTDTSYKLLDIELPDFMTIDKNYYNYSILMDIVERNLYDWLVFLYQKECYYNYDLTELSFNKNIQLISTSVLKKYNNIIFFLLHMGYEKYDWYGNNIYQDAKNTNNFKLLDYLNIHRELYIC